MGFLDILKQFSPIEEEQRAPAQASPVVPVVAPVETKPIEPVYEGYDVASAVAPLFQQKAANYVADQIEIPQLNEKDRTARQGEFTNSLEQLRNEYKAAQEDARSRQMKAEMLAAVGNNIGNIVGGAQAMNTKASVTSPQTSKIEVKDMVGRADKNFKDSYENLLKQYKDLNEGQLTPKDLLEVKKVNAFLKQGETRINNQTENINKGNIARGAGLVNKAEEQDEITSKDRAELTNINKTLDRIDKLEGMSKEFSTGPIDGRVEKIKAYIGANSGARAAMTAQLQGIVSAYGSSISGSTIGEGEFGRLQKQVPDENDNDEVYASKLARFKDEMESSRLRVIDDLRRSGRNVKNFENRASLDQLKSPAPPAKVLIQGPSGETKPVRADQAEKYLSKPGYKKVD